MPSLSELPATITRNRFLRALKKVGFVVNTKGGKGSHIKVKWPATGKCLVIQNDFRRDVLYHVVKEIELTTSVTWDDIHPWL